MLVKLCGFVKQMFKHSFHGKHKFLVTWEYFCVIRQNLKDQFRENSNVEFSAKTKYLEALPKHYKPWNNSSTNKLPLLA